MPDNLEDNWHAAGFFGSHSNLMNTPNSVVIVHVGFWDGVFVANLDSLPALWLFIKWGSRIMRTDKRSLEKFQTDCSFAGFGTSFVQMLSMYRHQKFQSWNSLHWQECKTFFGKFCNSWQVAHQQLWLACHERSYDESSCYDVVMLAECRGLYFAHPSITKMIRL